MFSIIRDGKEITLSEEEMYRCFCEVEHNMDMEDVQEALEERLEAARDHHDIDLAKFINSTLDNKTAISAIACSRRDLILDLGLDAVCSLDNAVDRYLEKKACK